MKIEVALCMRSTFYTLLTPPTHIHKVVCVFPGREGRTHHSTGYSSHGSLLFLDTMDVVR